MCNETKNIVDVAVDSADKVYSTAGVFMLIQMLSVCDWIYYK